MNDADLAWCINRLKTAAEERAHYDAAVDCKCEICTRINGMIEATDTAEDRIVAEIRADEREQCTIRMVRYFITDPLTGKSREVDKFPDPPEDYVAAPEAIIALNAAVDYEREQCCKDICVMCRNGRVATRELRKDAAYWCHDLDTCFAASIRERAWSWTGRSVTG